MEEMHLHSLIFKIATQTSLLKPLKCYKKSIYFQPSYIFPLFNIAKIYFKLNKFLMALKYLKKVKKINNLNNISSIKYEYKEIYKKIINSEEIKYLIFNNYIKTNKIKRNKNITKLIAIYYINDINISLVPNKINKIQLYSKILNHNSNFNFILKQNMKIKNLKNILSKSTNNIMGGFF